MASDPFTTSILSSTSAFSMQVAAQAAFAFLAREIQNANPEMFVREEFHNALQAVGALPPDRREPIRFFPVPGPTGVRKLAVYNVCESVPLAVMTQRLTSWWESGYAITTDGLGNIGQGARLTGLNVNGGEGLRYWYCTGAGTVYELLIRVFISTKTADFPVNGPTPVDAARLQGLGLDTSKAWVVVTNLGQCPEQDTVADPYGKGVNQPKGWLINILHARYYDLPAGVQVQIDNAVAGKAKPGMQSFLPLAQRLASADPAKVTQERVATGYGGIEVTYYWDEDGSLTPGVTLKPPTGVALSFTANGATEMYDVHTDKRWVRAAVQYGLYEGREKCGVVIHVPVTGKVAPDASRTVLKDGGRPLACSDFADLVYMAMPAWLEKRNADLRVPSDVTKGAAEIADRLIKKFGLTEDMMLPTESGPFRVKARKFPQGGRGGGGGGGSQMGNVNEEALEGDAAERVKRPLRRPDFIVFKDINEVMANGFEEKFAMYTPHTISINPFYPPLIKAAESIIAERGLVDGSTKERVRELVEELAADIVTEHVLVTMHLNGTGAISEAAFKETMTGMGLTNGITGQYLRIHDEVYRAVGMKALPQKAAA